MWPPRFDAPTGHPIYSMKSLEWDHTTGLATVVRSDGKRAVEHVGVLGGTLTATCFVVDDSVLRAPTTLGTTLEFDIGSPTAIPEVPVVYLDQNHWIELARVERATDRLDEPTRHAYRRLSELAMARRIVLPLSAAHLVEIARRSGSQRQDVALTMLKHSRGWQMRGPLEIRAHEIDSMFASYRWKAGRPRVANALHPVSLEPDALWNDRTVDTASPQNRLAEFGLDDVGRDLSRRMSWVSSLAEVFLEPVRESSLEGEQAARQWAESMQNLAQHMSTNPQARPHRRELTRARLVADLQKEIAVGARNSELSQAEFQEWLADRVEDSFAAAPALGRLREVMHERIINAADKWERNDLNDLMYLCTAAGYVDVVIAERKTSNYLRRVEDRTTRGATVTHRVVEATETVDALVA